MQFTFYNRFKEMAKQDGVKVAARYAIDHGFSSVEVSESFGSVPLFSDTTAATEAKKILAEHGLTAACYSAGIIVYQNPDAVAYLKKQVELVAALGCPYFHHTLLLWLSPTPGMPAFDEGIDCAVEVASTVANYAKTLGVRCIYEDQGLFANGVDGFGAFYHKLKQCCDNVGVCGDMGNTLFVDEKPENFFAAYANDICHVHVKDYLIRTFKNAPSSRWYPTHGGNFLRDTMVGDGNVDIAACVQILQKVGYTGSYALELCHPEPFDMGVAQAMAVLSSMDNEN